MNRRSANDRKELDLSALFVVALFAIMLIGIMALSAMGGGLFDSITENRADNMNRRGALSYVASRIIANDEKGALAVEQGENGDVLVIQDPSEEKPLQTRIWKEDGYLMEAIYSEQTQSVSSEPKKVAKVSEFSVSIEDQIAAVKTEDGIRRIYLHSKEVAS